MPDAPAWFSDALTVKPESGEVEVEGCPIRFLSWGDPAAPPLVLVHGGAAHARWWSFLAPNLAHDHFVIAPNLSGHGDSGWRDAYRSELWAEEILAVAETAAPRSRPVVVGHSLGAQVTAVLAARHGARLRGVVLADFGVRRPGEVSRTSRHFQNQRVYPTYEDAVARFKLIPRQPCENDWVVRHIAETSVREVEGGGWAWKFDWRLFNRTSDRLTSEYLADIDIPVAFLHGELSRVVTAEVAERVSRTFARPAPVVWIPDARHHLMLDQPLAFVVAVRALAAHLELTAR